MALIIGIISLICSLIEFFQCSDEVEAYVIGGFEEWKPDYKIDPGENTDGRSPDYSYVRYRYKGLSIKTRVKGIKQPDTITKIRVNPKKPNQCCMPHPDFEGLIVCCIFSVVMLGLYFLAKLYM